LNRRGEIVGVINFGIGTWASVVNMLDALGINGSMCRDPNQISKYSHLILPGVGNFSTAASKLDDLGWSEPLLKQIHGGVPTLGICLGMQLLGEDSEESPGRGLGVMAFTSKRLSDSGNLRVPHMGWNSVEPNSDHPIFKNWSSDFRFYFAHSYAVPLSVPSCVGVSFHNQPFSSVVAHENVVGVQFHPEKSHFYGKKVFENFVEMG